MSDWDRLKPSGAVNNLLDRFLKTLEDRGLSVGPGSNPGELLLHGPRDQVTETVMASLREFKPLLLKRFAGHTPREAVTPKQDPQPKSESEGEICTVCGRTNITEEDKPHLANNPALCDRGGSKEARDRWGTVVYPETPKCPYKPA